MIQFACGIVALIAQATAFFLAGWLGTRSKLMTDATTPKASSVDQHDGWDILYAAYHHLSVFDTGDFEAQGIILDLRFELKRAVNCNAR